MTKDQIVFLYRILLTLLGFFSCVVMGAIGLAPFFDNPNKPVLVALAGVVGMVLSLITAFALERYEERNNL